MQEEEKMDHFYNFGDPYYLESGYGLGYMPELGDYGSGWQEQGSDWGYSPAGGPNMGEGHGPAPGYGSGPGMGYGPGPGYGPGTGGPGYHGPSCPDGGYGSEEMMMLIRDTNEICREILRTMREHHQNGGCAMDK